MANEFKLSFTAAEIDEKLGKVDNKQDKLTFDSSPISGSTKPVTSGGVYNALSNKQDKLTFDSTPTENSTNPVTSGGVYTEVNYAKTIANMAMPGSLKWDGVVGDREQLIMGEEPVAEGIIMRQAFVHVSDYVPEILTLMMEGAPAEERILSALFSMSGEMFGEGAEEIQVQVADDMFIMSEGFLYVPTDGYSLEGFVFPKKGWYFMSVSVIMGNIEVPVAYINCLQIEGLNFPDTSGGSDKYFETVTNTETVELGDTLTWDGNTNGLVTVVVNESMSLAKVSDCIPTVTDVVNGVSMIFSGDEADPFEISGEDAQGAFLEDGGAVLGLSVFIVPTNNYVIDNSTFPESGVYLAYSANEHVSSFTIPDYNFTNTTTTTQTVIKTEHLPEALRFGEITTETRSNTLTWDGNTEGLVSSGAFYKVSNAVPTMDDFANGAVYGVSNSEILEIPADDIMDATVDGFPCIVIGEVIVVLEDEANINGLYFPQKGVYFASADGFYISFLAIPDYNGFVTSNTELVKIDPKYLPDDIGGGSGGSGLPEVSADDNGKSVSVVDGEWVVKKPSYNDLSDKPTLFSGSYNDLSDKPTLDTQMSDTSTNMVQNKVIKAYIDAAIGAAIAASY